MHQTLYIPELVWNIFSRSSNADLATLARTCKVFKEPALDLLWEELDDFTPLVRCLPEVSCQSTPATIPDDFFGRARYYSFCRPLNEAEEDTLRGYARRVRFIRGFKRSGHLVQRTRKTILDLTPFSDPLFPNLRLLHWEFSATLPALHVAVPSLTSLHLQFPCPPLDMDIFSDCCPHMRELVVPTSRPRMDATISRQVCRWPSLHRLHCPHVALNMDAITHLSSTPNLKQLSFTADMDAIQDISSKLVFSSLTDLHITSRSLDTITLLLSHIQLPAAKRLTVTFSNYISKRVIQACWAAAREASPSIVFIYLELTAYGGRPGESPGEDVHLGLMLKDLYPCTAFSELRMLHVNLYWHVSLTDADLLQLASPRMEKIIINDVLGWDIGMDGGGITLTGLVRLLQQCPSLNKVCLAIDTSTFTEIPEGLDVSFPPREELSFNFVDSYIRSEFVPGVVSVFTALKLDPFVFTVWDTYVDEIAVGEEGTLSMWERVQDKLRRVSG